MATPVNHTKNAFLTFLVVLICGIAGAQNRYYVFFTDKNGVSFDPYAYFDQKAIDRREKHGIPLDHYSDRPVRTDYVNRIQNTVDSIKMVTRWFNGVVCYASPQQIDLVGSFDFVRNIELISSDATLMMHDESLTPGQERLMNAQIERMEGDVFHEKGITGKGVRIAIFDAGFPMVDEAREFMHIRTRNGILKTWDFVSNKEDVYRKHTHGTMVLSNIAGIHGELPIGMAIDAEFLLARTEKILSESMSEEENWLAAAEWADKNGADVINSSLGYTGRRYFQKDLTGQSLVSKAADMAASKGIVVVNSAGNEGDASWKTLGAPADADSILTVGGINPWTNLHTSWSSYGPSADKRPKPNVCAYGHTIVRGQNGIEEVTGTSFSSPLTAGYVACMIQAFPEATNMEIIRKVEESGDLYPYFDYAHGYGVPQASKALNKSGDTPDPTFAIGLAGDTLRVVIDEEDFATDDIIVLDYRNPFSKGVDQITQDIQSRHMYDYQFNAKSSWPKTKPSGYLYVHFEGEEGYLEWYSVIGVHQRDVFELDVSTLSKKGGTLRFFYRGHMEEYNVK